jgi:hypothetical protein
MIGHDPCWFHAPSFVVAFLGIYLKISLFYESSLSFLDVKILNQQTVRHV